ncbi:MAG: DUF2236 domain-containing protein [Deltaproteobacteria bacterium]|nr:DUF2236 domain-containing protein [Deltaproteobacteria bacterium]
MSSGDDRGSTLDPIYDRLVTREEYESNLARVAADVPDRSRGLFGPESMIWKVSRENAVYLTGARTGLLQTAHPFVGYALEEQSYAPNSRARRFRSTLLFMSRMIYGDVPTALGAARKLFRRHETIQGVLPANHGPYPKGMTYRATHLGALLWAHIVIWDSSVMAYELIVGKLTSSELAQYADEVRRFGVLLGVPPEAHPRAFSEQRALIRDWIERDIIGVTPVSFKMAQRLLSSPGPLWTLPTQTWRAITSQVLEPKIARQFGFEPDSLRNQLVFKAAVRSLRLTYSRFPPVLRYMPGYLEATKRLQGMQAPGPIARRMNELWIGEPSFFPSPPGRPKTPPP